MNQKIKKETFDYHMSVTTKNETDLVSYYYLNRNTAGPFSVNCCTPSAAMLPVPARPKTNNRRCQPPSPPSPTPTYNTYTAQTIPP